MGSLPYSDFHLFKLLKISDLSLYNSFKSSLSWFENFPVWLTIWDKSKFKRLVSFLFSGNLEKL